MRTATGAELTRLNSQRFNIAARVELEDQQGAWQDVTNWGGRNFFVSASWSRMQDEPVMQGTVTLLRQIGGASLAPSMTTSTLNLDSLGHYSPFIRGGQKIRISTACVDVGVAPVTADWKEVFLGRVDNPDWGGKPNQMTIAISDVGGWLAQTEIQTERQYSTDTGVPVETVMQQILDDNVNPKLGSVALVTPVSPAWNIRTYTQKQTSVLDAIRSLALQIGWDVRYQYSAGNVFQLTFFQPQRTKTVADFTFGPSVYFDVAPVSLNTDDIRNFVRVKYVDHATGAIGTQDASDAASIAIYGPKFMEMDFDHTSNIDSSTEGASLAGAVVSDLSSPLMDQTMRTTFFWPAELGDLYAFTANGTHYDATQKLAVVGIQHDLTPTKRETTIQVRGQPAGAYKTWLTQSGSGPSASSTDTALDLVNFREKARDANGITYAWDSVTTGVTQVWAYELTLPNPVTGDPYKNQIPLVTPTRYDALTTTEVTFAYPPLDSTKYTQVEARDATYNAGKYYRNTIQAAGAKPQIVNLQTLVSISGSFAALSLDVTDSLNKGGTLRAWVDPNTANDADPTSAPDVAVVSVTPAHFDSTTTFTLGTGGTSLMLGHVQVHQGRGKRVYFEFVNSDGVSSGVQSFVVLSQGGVIDANGVLLDASINAASQFAASVQPIQVSATVLPSGGADGTFAFLTSDGKLYRRSGGSWTAAVQAVDISGLILGPQIADAAISTAKFALGIKPVELLSILPASPTDGRTAYNTVDGKLYRAFGGVWTAQTNTSDLFGQIVAGQVAAGAISTTELAAGAVTAGKVFANTLTASQIASNTILGTNIAGTTITGGNIAGNTITAGLMAANSIVAGSIAAGAVTTTAIFSGAVTSTKISVTSLSSINSNIGIIVAGQLNSVNGQSYIDLNATGSNPFIHHADSGGVTQFDLLANGSAIFYGTVASTFFTGTGASFVNGLSVGSGGSLFVQNRTIFLGSNGTTSPAVASDGTDVFIGGVHSGTTYSGQLKVNRGLNNLNVPGIRIDTGGGAPSASGLKDGDFWFDTTTPHLYLYSAATGFLTLL